MDQILNPKFQNLTEESLLGLLRLTYFMMSPFKLLRVVIIPSLQSKTSAMILMITPPRSNGWQILWGLMGGEGKGGGGCSSAPM